MLWLGEADNHSVVLNVEKLKYWTIIKHFKEHLLWFLDLWSRNLDVFESTQDSQSEWADVTNIRFHLLLKRI